jgi:Zn-dependent oligopeptidase
LDLRREQAKIQGYATWADYVEEDKMVKTANAVKEVHDFSLLCVIEGDELN